MEDADDARADSAAGEGRLADEHERVERVAVLAERPLDEAVVGRVAHRGEEAPVEHDVARLGVDLVLVPRAHRHLDEDHDVHRGRAYTRAIAMDPNALDVLEFPAIRERIARATATDFGAALAAELEPSPDAEEVARRQALTAEAIALLEESLEPPLDGIRDVREQAAHAALGGALAPQALRHVSDTATGSLLGACARSTRRRRRSSARSPEPIDPALAAVAKAIDRAVEEDGSDLRDNASPKLRRLRGELRSGQQRVREELEQLVRSSELREHLQEEFVTSAAAGPCSP